MRYRLLCRLAGGLAGLAVLAVVVLLGLDEWLSRGTTVRRGHFYGTAGGEPTVVYGVRRGTRCTVDGRPVLAGPRWRRWFDRFTGPVGGLRLPAEGRSRFVTCERAVRVVVGRRAALAQSPRPWWLGALLSVAVVALVVRAWSGRVVRRRLRALEPPVPVARGVWPVRPPAGGGGPRRGDGGRAEQVARGRDDAGWAGHPQESDRGASGGRPRSAGSPHRLSDGAPAARRSAADDRPPTSGRTYPRPAA